MIRKLIQLGALIIAAIHLHACAAPPARPNADVVKGITKVGVIALLGEQIEAKYVGFTMFGNEYFLTEDLGWHLNKKSIDVASSTLDSNGFEVMAIDYNHNKLWTKYRDSQESYSTRVSEAYGNDTTTPLLKSDLKRLGKQFSVDAFILLIPGHQGHYCQGGEPCIGYGNHGYGIHNRLNQKFNAYISTLIYFVPLKTLKTAAESQANIHVPVSIKRWKKSYRSYSAEEILLIREALYKAAEQAIPEAINRMSLSPN